MYRSHWRFFSISVVLILLVFFIVDSSGQSRNPSASCPSSSCGSLADIRFPFRLKTEPASCGYSSPYFQLDCQRNRTVLTLSSKKYYYVQDINYEEYSVRLVDPGFVRGNLSSCSIYSADYDDWPGNHFSYFLDNVAIVFIHCLSPVNSLKYVEAPFCGNRSTIFANSSLFYSYAVVGGSLVSDLGESCMVDRVALVMTGGPLRNNSSLSSIYDALTYGFELSWFRVLCEDCDRTNGFCALEGNTITCKHYCSDGVPISERSFKCQFEFWGLIVGLYSAIAIAGLIALRFLIGFSLLMWFVVYKWRRRHLSMDKNIEEFLQSQNTLRPIKYTYSEIKKMTDNFNQRLGEGGYGTVFKGKLRSGPYVAVKIMEQSVDSEEEFISEVGTIGRIHHVNVVQLIGFCVEGSKCALVYEFFSNGSLDRYIFNQQSLDILALTYEKMLQIAVGVARGIGYLHHGCDMQILHFDIKPHNILLDENFNPKISDFGLAQLYPAGGSIVNLTTARGTMGYMAPEMFYKGNGGISYKADVYSFGMLLLEMAGRRKNTNPLVEDASQIYFPSWVYDRLCNGKDIEIKDATDEEMKMVKRIIIVALWCIQMRPAHRPTMNKVVDMLESSYELQIPPKPFVAPHEIANSDEVTETYTVDYISLGVPN